MNTSQSVLALYQQSLVLSNECLLLAKKAEWDKLIDFASRYVTTIEKLSQLTSGQSIRLAADERQKARITLQRLISNEGEVKLLLQARRDELRGQINVTGQQQTVNNAYSQFAGRKNFLAGHIEPEENKE